MDRAIIILKEGASWIIRIGQKIVDWVVKGLSISWVSIKAIVCTKTFAIIAVGGLIILIIGGIVYWFFFRDDPSKNNKIKAVSDGEIAGNSNSDFN